MVLKKVKDSIKEVEENESTGCTVIVISLFSAGCSKSGSPLCSDSQLKSLVIDIATRETREQLLFPAMREFNLNRWGIATYEKWDKVRDKDENARKVLALVDKWIAESNMSLSSIRINRKRDDIKKCECGGELSMVILPFSIWKAGRFSGPCGS